MISSDLIDFFPVASGDGRPRSEFEREDGQTDSEKMAPACVFDVSGATSQSCKITRVIQMLMISRNHDHFEGSLLK